VIVHLSIPCMVKIAIDDQSSMLTEIREHLADVFLVYSKDETPDAPNDASFQKLQLTLSSGLSHDGMRHMESGVFGKPGAMLDTTFRTHLSRTADGELRIQSPTSALEWLVWVVQLALLEQQASFIHCAGLERNGRAILFPSWGGVGKTAITKRFVSDDGWRLLGDDLVIVARDGTCYGFPRAMVLYPYHSSVFPEVFSRGEGPIAPVIANEILTKAGLTVKPVLRRVPAALRWARRHNPQSVRIAPSKVFSPDALATTAQLDTVAWIERDATITEPRIDIDDELFVTRIVGTTLSEFNRHCTSLTPTLFGLGVFSYAQTYGSWHSILEQAFRGKRKWMISIPANLPVAEVPGAVKSLLDSVGFYEGT